jgi:hypothetical protein
MQHKVLMFAWSMILALALAGGLLLPVQQVSAAATGTVSPPQGPPGTTFTFTVTGLLADEEVGIWLTDPQGEIYSIARRLSSDSAGGVTWSWTADETARGGTWHMMMRGQRSRNEVSVPFTVLAPETPHAIAPSNMVLPERTQPPGSTFTFVARGQFAPGEQVGSWFVLPDGSTTDVDLGISADPEGQIYRQWVSPADAMEGGWTFRAEGVNTRFTIDIPFQIRGEPVREIEPSQLAPPSYGVTPQSGSRGTTFQFNASGFIPGERLGFWLIYPDGTNEDTMLDDWYFANSEDGTFSWSWTVPADAPPGAWSMNVRGTNSRVEWSIPISVVDTPMAGGDTATPGVAVSPPAAPAGTRFRFSDSGYTPGETVYFWATDPHGHPHENAKEATANAYGLVEWSWEVHSDKPLGQWMMSTKGEVSKKQSITHFTVTGPTPAGIQISPDNGGPGTTFTFSATGFFAQEEVDVWLTRPEEIQDRYDQPLDIKANLVSGKDGSVSWEWTAPAETGQGQWRMTARGETSRIYHTIDFIIERDEPIKKLFGVSPAEGSAGTTFRFFAEEIPTDSAAYWVTAPDGTVIPDMADFRAWTVDGMEGNHYEWTWTAPEDAQSGVWTMVIRSLTDEPQVDPLVLFDPNPENAKERIEERRQYDEDRLDSVLNARQYVITFHITP